MALEDYFAKNTGTEDWAKIDHLGWIVNDDGEQQFEIGENGRSFVDVYFDNGCEIRLTAKQLMWHKYNSTDIDIDALVEADPKYDWRIYKVYEEKTRKTIIEMRKAK